MILPAQLKGRDFLRVHDWEPAELLLVLEIADRLKARQRERVPHRHLEGRTLGMIFQKPSTRTRVSFEVGIAQLGGAGLYLAAGDLQLGRGETIKDTGRVLARYLDGIMIRTFSQADVDELAEHADVPVINGLTDDFHPCQALADVMTIRERLGTFDGVRVAYLGDGNNVCHSLMVACAKLGLDFVAATPEGYEPSEVEPRIFERWFDADIHHPEPEGDASENYSIAIPPPNVTGALHMGHALNWTIQDVLVRTNRMRGRRTKWILGTDHAGIATQRQVEKLLETEGTSRTELGRDAFVQRVWAWREK